jgi:hypothetical protein
MSQLFAQLTTPHWLLIIVALVVLFAAMWFKPIWQRNSVRIKGDNYGDISQNNTLQTSAAKGAGAEAGGGKSLSFVADVLQVISFAVLCLQVTGLLKS